MATEPNEVVLLRRENRHLLRTLLSRLDYEQETKAQISDLHTRLLTLETLIGHARESAGPRRRKPSAEEGPSVEQTKE